MKTNGSDIYQKKIIQGAIINKRVALSAQLTKSISFTINTSIVLMIKAIDSTHFPEAHQNEVNTLLQLLTANTLWILFLSTINTFLPYNLPLFQPLPILNYLPSITFTSSSIFCHLFFFSFAILTCFHFHSILSYFSLFPSSATFFLIILFIPIFLESSDLFFSS